MRSCRLISELICRESSSTRLNSGGGHLPADSVSLDRPLIGMISRMVDQKGLT